MNVDEILRALKDERVDYLLIGGMNFLDCEQKIRRIEILREAIRQSQKSREP